MRFARLGVTCLSLVPKMVEIWGLEREGSLNCGVVSLFVSGGGGDDRGGSGPVAKLAF